MKTPSLSALGWIFLRYGNITFGGGSATIARLDREVLDKHKLLGRESASLSFALARLTPGTNLLAYCTAVGWLIRGLPGPLVALLACSLPCSFVAVFVTVFYEWAVRKPVLAIALHGATAAAVGVMIATGWTIIRPFWARNRLLRFTFFSAGSCALALIGVAPLLILFAAALLGFAMPTSEQAR